MRLRCSVEGITHKGEGVGRIDGQAAFIPFAIPGETVEIEIQEIKKSFLRAQLVEVIEASPDRIHPPCPYYYRCGGCSLQHVAYPRQLQLKRQVVQDNLQRIGSLKAEISPVIGMNYPWRYRNKVEWHIFKKGPRYEMGYYLQESHTLLPIDCCLLISSEMEELGRFIHKHLGAMDAPGQCQLTIRQFSLNGQLMLIFKESGTSQMEFTPLLDYPGLASIYCLDKGRLIHKYGQTSLAERLSGLDYEISPLAFFQVNHQQTEVLIDLVKAYAQVQPSDSVLEGYCGIGTVTLPLTRGAGKIIGVESFVGAVQDAQANARRNNISNAQFVAGACEKVIPDLKDRFNVVVLDPPRAGCKKEVVEAVIQSAPPKIVYVSCNPGTLARDLKIFCQEQYEVTRVQPIDMFPQTHHVETVVLIERK